MFRTCLFLLIFLAGIIGMIIWGYFTAVPYLAGLAADHVPLQFEEQIGEMMSTQVKTQFEVDEELTLIADSFADVLKFNAPYDFKVTVINNPEVNAFAIPGGHIFIHSGLINKISKPEELAALLSHEASHIILKHSLKSVFSKLSGYLLISLLFSDAGTLTSLIFSAEDLKQLSYSRELESEADANGIRILEENNIHPSSIITLLESISKGEGTTVVPEFLSTHPVSATRISAIQSQIAGKGFKAQENQELERLWLSLKNTSLISK